ncbi:MAG: hypothetical protein MJ176_03340 [Treponema sp.]|nr:hypothetical protein [Treponema sp.]
MNFFEKILEMAKSMGVKNFAYYKKWALDHLKKQLDEEETVTKALEYCEEYLEKAYGVGTIRIWKGKKYIKGPDKKWRRYYEKHDRGANQAIKNIMREINSLENGDVEGLYAIIQKNQGRFRDENGNILPEVQQIHDLVEKKQARKDSEMDEKKAGTDTEKKNAKKWDISLESYKAAKEMLKENENLKRPDKQIKSLVEKGHEVFSEFSTNDLEHLFNDILDDVGEKYGVDGKAISYIFSIVSDIKTYGTKGFIDKETGKLDTEYAKKYFTRPKKPTAKDEFKLLNLNRLEKGKPEKMSMEDFVKQIYENEFESEQEKHQNRSNAMKGNDNAKKDGVTKDEKKEKTFDGTSLDTVMEKYANDKLVKKAVKDVSDMDFTSEDETKSFIAGTYQEDGYKIATDGRYLSMIKSDYPAEEEGKIKGNEKILKYNDKKIEQYKVNVTEAEGDLKRAAETKGTGSRDYEFAEKKLTEAKENLKRVENVKKTGFMDGTFPNYKKVIPSLGNNPNYGKVKGFDDFNKVLKNAMVAAAFAKNTKYPLSTIKVGDSVFDAQRLVKVMAMAKKYGLNEIIGNKENPDAPIEFKGEKGSVVIMPMYGSTTPMFDANTGAVNIEDQDKKEEFLSGGEKETRLTFAKNKSKYETKFDKDIIDIMNHFEKQKGLNVSKYYKDHNYIRTAKNPAHISNEGNEDFKNAMNDLKDLFQDYQGFITDVYNRRFEEGKENKNVSSKEIKKFFEDGVKKIKDKYGIQKSFLEQIEEISKSVNGEKQSEQKHDLEYYKKWAMSILDKQKEEPEEEDGPNEETIVKALAYTEMIAKAGYPVGTVREWKGKKYIKVAPNQWKPKYDKINRGAKMSLSHLKKAVANCNSEEELYNLINTNASRFRDENGHPLPEVQELHDIVSKRQAEMNNTGDNGGNAGESAGNGESAEVNGSEEKKEDKKKTSYAEKISAIQKLGKKTDNAIETTGSSGRVDKVAENVADDTVNAVKTAVANKEKTKKNSSEMPNEKTENEMTDEEKESFLKQFEGEEKTEEPVKKQKTDNGTKSDKELLESYPTNVSGKEYFETFLSRTKSDEDHFSHAFDKLDNTRNYDDRDEIKGDIISLLYSYQRDIDDIGSDKKALAKMRELFDNAEKDEYNSSPEYLKNAFEQLKKIKEETKYEKISDAIKRSRELDDLNREIEESGKTVADFLRDKNKKKDEEGMSNQAEQDQDKRVGSSALWDQNVKNAIKTGDANQIKSAIAKVEKEYAILSKRAKTENEKEFLEYELKYRKRDAENALKELNTKTDGGKKETLESLTEKYNATKDPDEREKILNEMMNLDRQDEEKILPAMFDKEDEGFAAWDKDQKEKYGDKSVEELQKLLDTKYKNVKKYTPEYSEAMKIGDMIQQKKRQK